MPESTENKSHCSSGFCPRSPRALSTTPTDTYALIGHPLGHSFSAQYFNTRFQREGVDARYINLDIPDILELPDIIRDHSTLRGLNVTIPYKQAVLPLLDSLTPQAEHVGAVNTIRIYREAEKIILIGHNTDCPAFRRTLQPLLQPHHTRALILGGTGGAARAVRTALEELQIPYTLVSRTAPPIPVSQAYPRGPQNTITYDPDILRQAIKEHPIIINATPLGMSPNIEQAPEIPYSELTPRHLCYDLIYNPAETRFLRLAREQGALTTNGEQMLHLQADLAYRFWTQEKTSPKSPQR